MTMRIRTLHATLNGRLSDDLPHKPVILAAAKLYDLHVEDGPAQANAALRTIAELIPGRAVVAGDGDPGQGIGDLIQLVQSS